MGKGSNPTRVHIGHGRYESLQAIYPYGPCQRLAVGAASVQSSAVESSTSAVEIMSTVDCWVNFSANPTAAANDGDSFFLGAGLFKTYGIVPGHKIAVIRDTANEGYLHIIEGSGTVEDVY